MPPVLSRVCVVLSADTVWHSTQRVSQGKFSLLTMSRRVFFWCRFVTTGTISPNPTAILQLPVPAAPERGCRSILVAITESKIPPRPFSPLAVSHEGASFRLRGCAELGRRHGRLLLCQVTIISVPFVSTSHYSFRSVPRMPNPPAVRTPLNAVVGASALLAETPLNDEQRELLQMLDSGASHVRSHHARRAHQVTCRSLPVPRQAVTEHE